MDICGVRYFLAVCEAGSFTEAARICGVSQPSVTTGVRRLERALGAPLFLRHRPIRLTPLGARLRPAFEAMRQASELITALTSRPDGAAAKLKVSPMTGPEWAANLVAGSPSDVRRRKRTGADDCDVSCPSAAVRLCRYSGRCDYQASPRPMQSDPGVSSRRNA